MAPQLPLRKRKSLVEASDSADDDLDGIEFDGVLSQSESDSEEDSDLEEVGLDDARSDGVAGANDDAASETTEPEDKPNYRVVKDAHGNERYEYDEVDPVYDSDDSDAQGGENTIGNIPLSFYDSYPHIGYDINGKKIMRPATGDALDSLLDSIELPKGWTGLTDPQTGKPLNLSQDELELLRRLQMNEITEAGYDQYPVRLSSFAVENVEVLTQCAGPCSILYEHRGADATQRSTRAQAKICPIQARSQARGKTCSRNQGGKDSALQAGRGAREGGIRGQGDLLRHMGQRGGSGQTRHEHSCTKASTARL
jgi:hypothetical protein